ncbi:Uu.00g114010.m01.CDS01 [Anthostomella pinea]|uniref:Uu.00g114010.m01.CDS01 n=1 Tax=Anthostomella pinea TaxID=933095 RepID=A0AAI8YGR2_9PEZI|nr:Uu.00g114010.m01.CDS01 [Anthostomella pinea]
MQLSVMYALTFVAGLVAAGVAPAADAGLIARSCPDQDCSQCDETAEAGGGCIADICCGCALC